MVVTGRRTFRNIADLENPRENLVGVATSASVGAITAEQLDSDVSDIDHFYTSRLPGEPADGVDDIHFHPSIPRTARVMLNVDF